MKLRLRTVKQWRSIRNHILVLNGIAAAAYSSENRENSYRWAFVLDRFLKERCYQKVAGHVWLGYLPRYGALCRHTWAPFTFHALTASPGPCFLYPLFLQPHEYIKVHAFLPNITCVHEQTDFPPRAPRSFPSHSRRTKLRFTCWQSATHQGFLLSISSFFLSSVFTSASDLYSFFRLIHFNISTF